MKVLCPVCGVQAVRQISRNSERVQHYAGFRNGERVYVHHRVGLTEVMKAMEVSCWK